MENGGDVEGFLGVDALDAAGPGQNHPVVFGPTAKARPGISYPS